MSAGRAGREVVDAVHQCITARRDGLCPVTGGAAVGVRAWRYRHGVLPLFVVVARSHSLLSRPFGIRAQRRRGGHTRRKRDRERGQVFQRGRGVVHDD